MHQLRFSFCQKNPKHRSTSLLQAFICKFLSDEICKDIETGYNIFLTHRKSAITNVKRLTRTIIWTTGAKIWEIIWNGKSDWHNI